MAHADILVEEYPGGFAEAVGALGGEVLARAALGALRVDFRMPLQIMLQAVGYILALRYDAHTIGDVSCSPRLEAVS